MVLPGLVVHTAFAAIRDIPEANISLIEISIKVFEPVILVIQFHKRKSPTMAFQTLGEKPWFLTKFHKYWILINLAPLSLQIL